MVNLDLAIEDLIDRLRSRQDLRGRQGALVLEHFFQDNNLMTLRELAPARGGRERGSLGFGRFACAPVRSSARAAPTGG